MKNSILKNLNQKLLTNAILSVGLISQTQAAPLSWPATLFIDQGVGAGTNTPCSGGSCFGMEVAPGLIIWTNIAPGTDGGLAVGKNQASGGQELGPSAANSTSGEVTAAWNFFANFGTFYTPDGVSNVINDASCAGPTCIGATSLASFNVAWNGASVPLGSADGCNSPSCSADQLAGIFITDYTTNGYDSLYSMHFGNVVPDGDPSSFGNVRFSLILKGYIGHWDAWPTFTPTPSPTTIPTPSPDPTTPLTVELSSLDGTNGFRLNGEATGDRSGHSVSTAGDINGDGLDDIIIGAPHADTNGDQSGSSYVVFGSNQGFDAQFALSSLDGSNGFKLNGRAAFNELGSGVSAAGDVNGDGLDDLIIGAPAITSNSVPGSSYVVFGSTQGFAAQVDLSSLDGSNGFKLNGEAFDDRFGFSLSAAGDINGDGLDDIIMGAFGANTSYVVFGTKLGFSAQLDLSSLDGSNGFKLNGEESVFATGLSVSAAGDINGDGHDDIIIGAPFSNPVGIFLGHSYVVFGKTNGFSAQFELSSLDGLNGFKVNGGESQVDLSIVSELIGISVSAAGDINGDGFDDLIIGDVQFDANSNGSFTSYVVFGSQRGFTAEFALTSLDGSNGFKLNGEDVGDGTSINVSAAGDINGDGTDDLIIGSSSADSNGTDSGASYVVFGSKLSFSAQIELTSLDGKNGFRLDGEAAGDSLGISVSEAGDINGDGADDLIIGAPGANASYVVFGQASTTPSPTPTPTPTPDLTTCEGLYPQTEVTMLGKGKASEAEETLTTTFKGHIVSTDEAKGKVTICRGSTVRYEVVSTVGTARCTVKHGGAAESIGTLTDKGKLVCTNKPDGKDTDKFKIKRSKKKDVEVERRWFR